jgi:transporter family protein
VLLWSLAVILFWGVAGFMTKWASGRIGMQVLMWRVVMQMGISFAYLGTTGALKQFQSDRNGLLVAILAGVLGALGQVGYYVLIDRYQVSLAVPLSSLYPLVTVLLAVLFLREQLNAAQWLGAILAVGAIVLLGYGGS